MLKRISLVFLILIFPVTVWAQGNLRINNQAVEEGQRLNLFAADLEAGKVIFSLGANKLKSAEITFDGGRNWQAMERERDYFIFPYRPLSEEVIVPEFLLTNEDGSVRTYRPNIKINYQKKTPDEAVQQVLEKMKMYYEQENIDRFISLFSSTYPDRVKFQESIQNDFYNYKNIRLRYRIDRRTFDSDYQGAIWDVYWERKYDSRTGTSSSDSANIAMRLDKEGINWLISGLRNNTIFGSSLLVTTVDLSVTASDILFVNGGGGSGHVDISATVHNSGGASASNVKVNFYESATGLSGPWTLIDSRTISSISGSSTGTTTSVSYNGTPFMIWYFRIVVDPDGTITETDETNNDAATSHTLP